MTAPRATLRLQFHRGFNFADAQRLLPYFAALGVSHIYASPILTARSGSMHGYDVIDPTRVNPELGGEDEFRRLVAALRRHELGLIVDIVPNHMAVGAGNRWWMDVLANGRASRFAKFFDIDWRPPNPALADKVLLPVLGRPYGEALAAGEIMLGHDGERSVVHYFDHVFPVAPAADDTADMSAFDPRSSAGRERLHRLLESQHYRLSWWRIANDEINWRRFFDINELAAIRVEDDEVFDAVHATVLRLYADGLVDGVRVDHIDGLSQPEAYCRKLRARLRELESARPPGSPAGPAYLVVEKILAADEALPKSWQTDGTTGYDFMDQAAALLHDPRGEQPLSDLWLRISGRSGDFADEEELARRQILARSFAAQLGALVQTLSEIADRDLATRDYAGAAIRRALIELLAHFPVYRIYAGVDRASPSDRALLSRAVARAKTTCLPGDAWLVDKLGEWLAGKRIRADLDALQGVALARFQQLSAPLSAKAVEDTAFYRYGRLISRNDVGFDARRFALPVAAFHQRMAARAVELPDAMLATATHDHKRGEDVRARLAVLSEMPHAWSNHVERWLALSAAHCAASEAGPMPSPGDLAILFQTIVGSWPMAVQPNDRAALAAFSKRIAAWQEKAMREAKLRTDWSAPNEAYERAARHYVDRLFGGESPVLAEIVAFAQRIAPAGAANGLAQVLTKLTAPGVPDIYQGTEYWDLSLVDPDNRSPVDFAVRQKSLGSTADEAATHWTDGRIKQHVVGRILAVRKKLPDVFSEGSHVPLQTAGELADHVVAWARQSGDAVVIAVFCRFSADLLGDDGSLRVPASRWQDTKLVVPTNLQGAFANALMPQQALAIGSDFCIAQILRGLPVGFLVKQTG